MMMMMMMKGLQRSPPAAWSATALQTSFPRSSGCVRSRRTRWSGWWRVRPGGSGCRAKTWTLRTGTGRPPTTAESCSSPLLSLAHGYLGMSGDYTVYKPNRLAVAQRSHGLVRPRQSQGAGPENEEPLHPVIQLHLALWMNHFCLYKKKNVLCLYIMFYLLKRLQLSSWIYLFHFLLMNYTLSFHWLAVKKYRVEKWIVQLCVCVCVYSV